MFKRVVFVVLIVSLFHSCDTSERLNWNSPVDVNIDVKSLPSDQQITIDINGHTIEMIGQERITIKDTFYPGDLLWPKLTQVPQARGCVIENVSYKLTETEPAEVNIDCSVSVEKNLDSLANLIFVQTQSFTLGVRGDSVAILDMEGETPSLTNVGQKFNCEAPRTFKVEHFRDDQIILYCNGNGFAISDVSNWGKNRQLSTEYQLGEVKANLGVVVIDGSILALGYEYENDKSVFTKINEFDGNFSVEYSRVLNGDFRNYGSTKLKKLSSNLFTYVVSEGGTYEIRIAGDDEGILPSNEVLFTADSHVSLLSTTEDHAFFYHDNTLKTIDIESHKISIIKDSPAFPNGLKIHENDLYVSYSADVQFHSYAGNYSSSDISVSFDMGGHDFQDLVYKYRFNPDERDYRAIGRTASITRISDILPYEDKLIVSSEMESFVINSELDEYQGTIIDFDPLRVGVKFATEGNLLAVAKQELGVRFYTEQESDFLLLALLEDIGYVYDVKIENNVLYVALGEDGIKVFDISDISNIHELGSYLSDDLEYSMIKSIAVTNGFLAYRGVKEEFPGFDLTNLQVHIVNATDPSNIQAVKSFGSGLHRKNFFNASEQKIYTNSRAFYFFKPTVTGYGIDTVEVVVPEIPNEPGNWLQDVINEWGTFNGYTSPLAADVTDSRIIISYNADIATLGGVGTPALLLLEFNEELQRWNSGSRLVLDSPAIKVSLGEQGFTVVDLREAKNFDYLDLSNPTSLFPITTFVSELETAVDGLLLVTDFGGVAKVKVDKTSRKAERQQVSEIDSHQEILVTENGATTAHSYYGRSGMLRRFSQFNFGEAGSRAVASIDQKYARTGGTQFLIYEDKAAFVDRLFGYARLIDFTQAEPLAIVLEEQEMLDDSFAHKVIRVSPSQSYAVVRNSLYGYSFDGSKIEVSELREVSENHRLHFATPNLFYCDYDNIPLSCEIYNVGENIPMALPTPTKIALLDGYGYVGSDGEFLYQLTPTNIEGENQYVLNTFLLGDEGVSKIHTEVLTHGDKKNKSNFTFETLNGKPVIVVNNEIRWFKYDGERIKFTSGVHLLEKGTLSQIVDDELYLSKDGKGLISITGYH